MRNLNYSLRRCWSFVPLVGMGTLILTTFYAVLPILKSVPSSSSASENWLGVATKYEMQLKNIDESKRAFNNYCKYEHTDDCTVKEFCQNTPRHCFFPERSNASDNSPNSYQNAAQSSESYSEEATMSYHWCWETESFTWGFCRPSSTPSPSQYSEPTQSTTTSPYIVPASNIEQLKYWCYDTDGANIQTRGICRDARGTYTDSCISNGVREYVCQGTWNGKEYTKQRCEPIQKSCSHNDFCQVGVCVQRTETAADQVTPTQYVAPSQYIPSTESIKPTTKQERPKVTVPYSPTPNTVEEQKYTNKQTPTEVVAEVQSPQLQQEQTPTEKQILSPPSIVHPVSGTILSGNALVEIDTRLFSSVTILLQPVVSVDARMYLGKVSSSGSSNINWDTTLTPNGEYYLFAVAHKAVQQYISDPIKIEIKNEITPETIETQLILASDFKPERVPISDQLIMSEIKTEASDVGQAIQMEGTAEPNSVVTILIYSNPVVVTVRADANGVWKYTLEEPLEEGEHTAYVVVPQKDGSQIRSEISTFIIPPVYASAEDDLTLHQTTVAKPTTIRNFVIVAVLLIADAIAILLFVYRLKNKRRKSIHVE